MNPLLSRPWRVNRRMECLYVDAPGECCVDITSGKPEDRARVMALLEQVQKMARILHALCNDGAVSKADAEAVLRDAGLMSETTSSVEGT